ncbi:MAG: hypothetical protein SynsKO_37680 [Synoicihabitans sp.]
MSRDIIFLLIGLALLWTPRSALRLGKPRKKRTSMKTSGGPIKDRLPGDHSLWVNEEVSRLRNWLDFGRALGGSIAIITLVPVFVDQIIGVDGVSNTGVVFATQSVIFLAAVLIQMIRIEERLTLFPPIFFVLGLSYAIVGWKASLIGFFAIWAINLVLPNPALFMAVYGVLMIGLSVFFGAGVRAAGLLAMLSIGPPLIAVLSGKRLVQFKKKSRISTK